MKTRTISLVTTVVTMLVLTTWGNAQSGECSTAVAKPPARGTVCSLSGKQPCTHVTEGTGDTGTCFTSGSAADGQTCECVGKQPPPPPRYSISVDPISPPSLPSQYGGHVGSNLTVTPLHGYTGRVHLSCLITPPQPSQLTCGFSSSVIGLPGPNTSGLRIDAVAHTPAGTYQITVDGVDDNGMKPAPSATPLPTPLTIKAGGGPIALFTGTVLLALWSIKNMRRSGRLVLQ